MQGNKETQTQCFEHSGGRRGITLLDTVGKAEGGVIWKNSIETCILPYVKWIASGSFLHDAGNAKPVLCDKLEGWKEEGGEGGYKREGTYVNLWLIHVDVWQKKKHHNIAQ